MNRLERLLHSNYAPIVLVNFRWIVAEWFILRPKTQKTNCRVVQGLSIGIQQVYIPHIITRDIPTGSADTQHHSFVFWLFPMKISRRWHQSRYSTTSQWIGEKMICCTCAAECFWRQPFPPAQCVAFRLCWSHSKYAVEPCRNFPCFHLAACVCSLFIS